jgi:sialate O-acetylesterase
MRAGAEVSCAIGADGTWRAEFPAMSAGGPHELTIAGPAQTVVMKNVLVGDVWVCIGRGAFGPTGHQAPSAAALAARLPATLRLVALEANSTARAAPDCVRASPWTAGADGNALYRPAAALAFASELIERSGGGAPLGLVLVVAPSLRIEPWIERSRLEADPGLKPLAESYDAALAAFRKAAAEAPAAHAEWVAALDRAEAEGEPMPRGKGLPPDPRADPEKPCGCFNGIVAPLSRFPCRGLVWSHGGHGDLNVNQAQVYARALPALIESWRAAWRAPALPFVFTGIGSSGAPAGDPRESGSAALREAQRAALALPAVGMVDTAEAAGPDAPVDIGKRLAERAAELARRR